MLYVLNSFLKSLLLFLSQTSTQVYKDLVSIASVGEGVIWIGLCDSSSLTFLSNLFYSPNDNDLQIVVVVFNTMESASGLTNPNNALCNYFKSNLTKSSNVWNWRQHLLPSVLEHLTNYQNFYNRRGHSSIIL